MNNMDNRMVDTTAKEVMLIVEESISFVLKYYNLTWNPPYNIEELVRDCKNLYFTPGLGKAIVHHCLVRNALERGQLSGFQVRRWIQMSLPRATAYMKLHFKSYLITPTRDEFYENLYMLSFAGYLCVYAIKNKKYSFPFYVAVEIARAMYTFKRSSNYYWGTCARSRIYNHMHKQIHDESEDDGFETGTEGD
ncbi:uncharacterized protein CDAR_212501 [Caerostris darwini]|uniref:Uncharacterized protein n=1 Tax=Caerostris darwini TaxID=1538125 RepID=A0AAV4PJD9_9ARAC|nr:uncharacterized protein CDAR_212501 [Caerostris darwini]